MSKLAVSAKVGRTVAASSRTLVAGIVALVATALTGNAFAAATRPALNGTWEGPFGILYEPSKAPKTTETFVLRVQITGQSARVFLKEGDDWIEAKPGAFRVQQFHSNAIIAAIDSGNDEDGVWVETWNIAVTPQTDDTLLAIYARLVTNEDLPVTSDHKAFVAAGKGELRRAK